MKKSIIIAASLLLAIVIAITTTRARADSSSTCPVINVQPGSDGTAVVTFDCGAEVFAIKEPHWP